MARGRYIRQQILSEIGTEGSAKLTTAKVYIVGCGGLGSIAAPYLSGAGGWGMILVDSDKPELSNLHRQVFFTPHDNGTKAKHFYGVAQSLGKPFWFGTKSNCTVFALQGNPISSCLCAQKYFKHWLSDKQARPLASEGALLTEDVFFRLDLTYFLEVSLVQNDQGVLCATPRKGNGSGDMANLVTADAFIELPQVSSTYPEGWLCKIYRFR